MLLQFCKLQLGHLSSQTAHEVRCDKDTNLQLFLFWQPVAFLALCAQEFCRRRSSSTIERKLRHSHWLIDLSSVLTTVGVSARQMDAVRRIPVVVACSKILAPVHELQLLCRTLGPRTGPLLKRVYEWDTTDPSATHSCFSTS